LVEYEKIAVPISTTVSASRPTDKRGTGQRLYRPQRRCRAQGQPGDLIIIIAYGQIEKAEAARFNRRLSSSTRNNKPIAR
jgi:hypothetical protein